MQLNRCTGCQLCVMACSLNRVGSCGENGSLIKILSHPEYDYFLPVIAKECLEESCKGECVDICSVRVLKLADEELGTRIVTNPKWSPVFILN